MNFRQLGRTGLMVSELGLGALEVGRPWGIVSESDSGLPPDDASADRFLNHALDCGINFIDTAAAYWASEERIGRALSGRREEYVLASKWGEWCDEKGSVYDYSPKAMWSFLESSIRKLKTDCIDLYQIHSVPLDVIQRGDAVAEMIKAREQGKIRFIGASCGEQEALAAIDCGEFDTLQISYNLLNTDMDNQVLPHARKKDLGVIIKDGLAGGRLTQKIERLGHEHSSLKEKVRRLKELAGVWAMSLPELSLRFVLSNNSVSSVIAGTKRIGHLEEDIKAADGAGLSTEQMAMLKRVL